MCVTQPPDQYVLGDLEDQPLRRDAMARERGGDVSAQPRISQLATRQVDSDHELFTTATGGRPHGELAARLVEDEVSDGMDQAAPFGDRNEFRGWDHAARGVTPADERLGAQ